MGVCVGLLPTKGLPFPLLSYGGSSALTVLLANLVVDLLYGVVDPRIRLDAGNR